ncbi:MAG: hypothetical protein ACI8Z5_001747 [Lentimonas sp.]|jgi:hypothetical protein
MHDVVVAQAVFERSEFSEQEWALLLFAHWGIFVVVEDDCPFLLNWARSTIRSTSMERPNDGLLDFDILE